MNANTQVMRSVSGFTPRSPLEGFGNHFRKETLEWVRTKRALTTLVVASGLLGLGAFGERMRVMFDLGLDVMPANLSPDYNFAATNWTMFVFLCAAFATMGLMAAERERGTLAWSLSMPVHRTAVLISKFISASVAVAAVAVIGPALAIAGLVWVCYGGWPTLGLLFWLPLSAFAVSIFAIALVLTLSTFVRSQAVVIGTLIVLAMLAPGLVGALFPDLARFLPSSIDAAVFAFGMGGASVDPVTPISWAASIVGLLTIATIRLRNMEL